MIQNKFTSNISHNKTNRNSSCYYAFRILSDTTRL